MGSHYHCGAKTEITYITLLRCLDMERKRSDAATKEQQKLSGDWRTA